MAVAAAAADAAALRAQLSNVEHNSAGNRELKEKVKVRNKDAKQLPIRIRK